MLRVGYGTTGWQNLIGFESQPNSPKTGPRILNFYPGEPNWAEGREPGAGRELSLEHQRVVPLIVAAVVEIAVAITWQVIKRRARAAILMEEARRFFLLQGLTINGIRAAN